MITNNQKKILLSIFLMKQKRRIQYVVRSIISIGINDNRFDEYVSFK